MSLPVYPAPDDGPLSVAPFEEAAGLRVYPAPDDGPLDVALTADVSPPEPPPPPPPVTASGARVRVAGAWVPARALRRAGGVWVPSRFRRRPAAPADLLQLEVPDSIWCTVFPSIPSAVRRVSAPEHGGRDRTLLGYTGNDRYIKVAAIDHADGSVEVVHLDRGSSINDHNTPTILPLSNGRLLLLWTFHGTTGNDRSVRYCTTGLGDDLGDLGPVALIDYGVRTHYEQPFEVMSGPHAGRVGVWSRVGSYPSGETWRLAFTDDLLGGGPVEWTQRTVWNQASNRLYQLLRKRAAGGYWVGLQTHPIQGGNQRLYIARFDEVTGEVYVPDTDGLMSSVYDEDNKLPLTWTNAQQVYDTTSGDRTRMMDVNPWGDVIYAVWKLNMPVLYYVAWRQGDGSYVHEYVAHAGALVTEANGYLGDASFSLEERDVGWISRESGGVWRVFRIDRQADGTWLESQVSTRTTPALRFRPRAVINAHPSLPVLWNEAAVYTGLSSWSGSVTRSF